MADKQNIYKYFPKCSFCKNYRCKNLLACRKCYAKLSKEMQRRVSEINFINQQGSNF